MHCHPQHYLFSTYYVHVYLDLAVCSTGDEEIILGVITATFQRAAMLVWDLVDQPSCLKTHTFGTIIKGRQSKIYCDIFK